MMRAFSSSARAISTIWALCNLQGADARVRLNGGVEPHQRGGGLALLLGAIDKEPAADERTSEEHVLGDGQLRHLLELLVDHGNAGAAGVERSSKSDDLPVDRDRARVRLHDA